jgi:hypothetical protein
MFAVLAAPESVYYANLKKTYVKPMCLLAYVVNYALLA